MTRVIFAPCEVFLLFISSILIKSEEIKDAAVSATILFCFKRCEAKSRYKIDHDSGVTIHIPCDSEPQIPAKYEGRLSIDKATGCVTLRNTTKSDGGLYTLEHKNGHGDKESHRQIRYRFHDKVWISELSRNDTDGRVSLTVGCAGEPKAIIWMQDGEHLPDGDWLSADNRTLTIPYNVTGKFTVIASNLVSADSKNITPIQGLGDRYVGHIMYPNMTGVKWGEGGDEGSNQTLLLPRNATDLYVMIPSEKPAVPASRDRGLLLLLLLAPLAVALLVSFLLFWLYVLVFS
ncbi:hypothetical protein GDO78_010212 [Eleutherodactylus coqui]|uniref:Uncharacterized protein n=1 Tax=Eleutherodactylus coqui TaxID=57060 RepID=A0A8J6F5R3_ELECQ|nr:hypothetical protein GDO78_010212 [Eleutherodactylus coqui]